ncbi:hypothetical protein, partial [Algoriphagus boritolerans]|uniref:hypothetical protein n=1 Tax=Algoriphagus boritolerans TaxID=308111 RepID=UPI001F4858A7
TKIVTHWDDYKPCEILPKKNRDRLSDQLKSSYKQMNCSGIHFHCPGIHISFQVNNLGQRWALPSFSFPGLRRASLPGVIEKFDHSVVNPWTSRFNNTCVFKLWIIPHSLPIAIGIPIPHFSFNTSLPL